MAGIGDITFRSRGNEPVDFSTKVPSGAMPMSPDGGKLVQAAETQAQGQLFANQASNRVGQEAIAEAADATKGYLESGMEKDINSTLQGLKASNDFAASATRFDIMSASGDASPKDLEDAKAEITKYQNALTQGVMTREQALLSIDKTVKEYSNILPGYATDLRKLAATVTGVEHMGHYAEYAMLTRQTSAEKLQQNQLEFQQKMQQEQVKAFVDKYHRMPSGGLTGPDMSLFREQATMAAHVEELQNQLKSDQTTVALGEPIVQDIVNARTAMGIVQLQQHLQAIVDPKTGTVVAPENRPLLRQQVLSDVGSFFEGLKSELLTVPSNKLSAATRETMLNRLNTQQGELTKALQNQDAFDDFTKTMKLEGDKAKNIMDHWQLAHPDLTIFSKSGMISPDMAKMWAQMQQDPRRSAEFDRQFPMFGKFFKAMSNPNVQENYKNNTIQMGLDPTHLDAVKQTDPAQHAVLVNKLRDSIQEVAKNGWGQEKETQDVRKKQFSTWLESFGNQIDATKGDQVDAWTKLVADPGVAKRIKELDKEEQLKAVAPVYMKTRTLLEDPTVGLFKRLGDLQRESGDKMSGFIGTPFEVRQNPVTGLLELKGQASKTTRSPREFTDITGAGAAGMLYQGPPATYDTGGTRGFGEVKQVVENINRGLTALNNFKDIPGVLPEDLQKRGVNGEYISKFNAGYFNMTRDEQVKALDAAKAGPDWKAISEKMNSPEAQDTAAMIHAHEAGNDPAKIQGKIDAISKALEHKGEGTNAEARAVLKSSLKTWQRALELTQNPKK